MTEQILVFVSLMLMVGARPAPSNPVSATTDTVSSDAWQRALVKRGYATTLTSGPWQYTIWITRKTYTAQDTLNVMLQIQNVGTTSNFYQLDLEPKWYLTDTSGHVMFSVVPTYRIHYTEEFPLAPGGTMLIGPLIHALKDSVGNPLTAGSYILNVNYGGHLLALKVTVQ